MTLDRSPEFCFKYLSRDNVLIQRKFYLSVVQISLYLSVIKQFTLSKTVCHHANINSLINSVDPDQLASEEVSCFQCNM